MNKTLKISIAISIISTSLLYASTPNRFGNISQMGKLHQFEKTMELNDNKNKFKNKINKQHIKQLDNCIKYSTTRKQLNNCRKAFKTLELRLKK